jgi:hypothetical protein
LIICKHFLNRLVRPVWVLCDDIKELGQHFGLQSTTAEASVFALLLLGETLK